MVCVLFFGSSFILHPSSFASSVPPEINYQGILADNQGEAVTAGTYRVEFRIWDDATETGSAHLLWGREYSLQVMEGGRFNVLLADSGGTAATNPAPQMNDLMEAFQDADRFLGLTITEIPSGPVGSPAEISPRQRLVSAPFVFFSGEALDAEQATGGFRISNGLVVASGGLEVNGNATLHGTLTVDGAATFNSYLTVDANLIATNQSMTTDCLHVYFGEAAIIGDTTVTGDLAVDSPAVITGFGTAPLGAIIMWYGSITDIPSGWVLCDGDNNTPDLRNRFVVGAGSEYAQGDTGGEDFHTLTILEMPSHQHSYNYRTETKKYWLAEKSGSFWKNTDDSHTGYTGGDAAHENRPPFHALCYIMRVE